MRFPTFIRKHLEAINNFSKVAGHRISLHKPRAFLYTSNKQEDKEMIDILTFPNNFKENKILRNKANQGGEE